MAKNTHKTRRDCWSGNVNPQIPIWTHSHGLQSTIAHTPHLIFTTNHQRVD